MLVLYNKYCSTIVKFAEYVPFLPDWLDDFWLYTCFSYVGLMLCWVISKYKKCMSGNPQGFVEDLWNRPSTQVIVENSH